MEREAQAIYWQNHKEELAAMGGSFSTEGLEGQELVQGNGNRGQGNGGQGDSAFMDSGSGPSEAAPWDMLMAQASGGGIGTDGGFGDQAAGLDKTSSKAPARRPVLSRQADKRISRSLTRAGRAGARTGTAGLARIRNIRSNVPITRMSYMDVTLKTSPWRLRRLTGRLGK